MRKSLIFVFSVIVIQVSGQSFMSYKDTINNFSINIPVGWKYGINKNYPSIKLLAYRIPLDKLDTSRDNLNININESSGNDLDKAFENFLGVLGESKNFKIIDKGDTIINRTKFKWLIETHTNENSDIQMHNYDLMSLKDEKTYVLTMVTFSNSFIIIKPLFDQIASSFSLLK